MLINYPTLTEKKRNFGLLAIFILSLTVKVAIFFLATDPVIFNKYPYFAEQITKGFDRPPIFYFVHSYHFVCRNKSESVATTPYGGGFTSAVQKENICGTQFHPEKSQKPGLQLIKNFLKS